MNKLPIAGCVFAALAVSQLSGQDVAKPQLPPSLGPHFWKIPDADVDQYGNPVVARDGRRHDPKTGWPYEVWLARVESQGVFRKKRIVTASNWMEFVLVPAEWHVVSELRDGLNTRAWEQAVRLRRARLGNPIYIGKYEVTKAQFASFDPWRGKYLESPSPKHPAYPVPWIDAGKFCERLAAATETKVRLPTDMEWEAACRAGTKTQFPWGDTLAKGRGNFAVRDGKATIAPVGCFPPNGFGLYDVIAGVSEWCAEDNRVPHSTAICRGGHFMNLSGDTMHFMLTCHKRYAPQKGTRTGYRGLRICVTAR